MTRILIGILPIILLLADWGRAASIVGYVTEAESGTSITAANVYVRDLRLGSIADQDGYYVIANVPPGPHEVTAYLVGYEPLTYSVQVDDTSVRQDFVLEREIIEIEGVEVEADRVPSLSIEIPPSRDVLRARDLKLAPVFAEPDPIKVFKTLPGVLQLSDFSVGLYVRGGTPDQNLILVDGANLYNVSHLFGLFSMFPADAVKSAELLKGGFPAQYGGRLSSVLNITTNDGNRRQVTGSGGISLISSRLTLEGPVGNGSWMLSGRRTYLEPILKIASEFNSGLSAFGYNFYDVQGKMRQSIGEHDQFTASFYAGDDNLRYDEPTLDVRQLWGNRAASGVWTHLFSDELVSHWTIAASRYRSRLRLQLEDLGVVEQNRLFDVQGKMDMSWFASEHHRFNVGIDAVRHDMTYDVTFGEGDTLNTFATQAWHTSAYAQDTYKPWPFLSIQPGIRASWFSNGGYRTVNPRLATRYQIGKDTFLKASVGRYSQHLFRVAREFQGLSIFSDLWFTSDSTASPSHAWQYIAGFETRLGDDLDVDIEAYYKDFDRLAEFNSAVTEANPTSGELLRRGGGEAYGFEFGVKKRAGRHTGWLSYSLSWATRTIDGINPADPSNPESEPLPYYPKFDQRHALTLVYQWQINRTWTFNSRYSYASGQPYTPVLGRYQLNDDLLTWEQTYTARRNSVRLPYYSRLDLGVRATFEGWGVTWQPFVQAINVLNRDNIYNRYWTDGDAEAEPPTAGKETNLPQLPFLITIGVDISF